jgi:hypothetical protein
MVGLLGLRPSRKFKILREQHPAIFRFNGQLFMEDYNIDQNVDLWIPIPEEYAQQWLKSK